VQDDLEEYRKVQTALIVSRRVINSVLNQPDVKLTQLIREADPDPFTWFEKNLRVSSVPSSAFIRVELDGENSDEVLTVLRAVAKAYQEVSRDRDHRGRARDRLRDGIESCE
jgi:hypothetical protein